MPSDLKLGLDECTILVVDQLGLKFPFSRGIMASSILATGIDTPKAYSIAQKIQEILSHNKEKDISSEQLTILTAEVLSEEINYESSELYIAWQNIRKSGIPIVISLSASSGIGKSTLATRLSLRLGINRVITSDSIREVLRTVIPDTVLPELHVSSYESIETTETDLKTFKRQAHAIAAASGAVAKRYIVEKKPIIIEGVHLIPGNISQSLKNVDEKPIVVELLLSLEDENKHLNQLIHRSSTEPLRKGNRSIENFSKIREIQNYLRKTAQKFQIDEYHLDENKDLTKTIVQLVVEKSKKR